MYLIDTNIISELRRVKPHGAILAWIESVEDAIVIGCTPLMMICRLSNLKCPVRLDWDTLADNSSQTKTNIF